MGSRFIQVVSLGLRFGTPGGNFEYLCTRPCCELRARPGIVGLKHSQCAVTLCRLWVGRNLRSTSCDRPRWRLRAGPDGGPKFHEGAATTRHEVLQSHDSDRRRVLAMISAVTGRRGRRGCRRRSGWRPLRGRSRGGSDGGQRRNPRGHFRRRPIDGDSLNNGESTLRLPFWDLLARERQYPVLRTENGMKRLACAMRRARR